MQDHKPTFKPSVETLAAVAHMRATIDRGKWSYEELSRAAGTKDIRSRVETIKREFQREHVMIGTVRGWGLHVRTSGEELDAGEAERDSLRRRSLRRQRRLSCMTLNGDAALTDRWNTQMTLHHFVAAVAREKTAKRLTEAVSAAHRRLPIKETLALMMGMNEE